jgi:hypothetical protein
MEHFCIKILKYTQEETLYLAACHLQNQVKNLAQSILQTAPPRLPLAAKVAPRLARLHQATLGVDTYLMIQSRERPQLGKIYRWNEEQKSGLLEAKPPMSKDQRPRKGSRS